MLLREVTSLIIVKVLVAQSCLTLCGPVDSRQAPLSMGFSRQEFWSGLPCPSPGDLPNPGVELASPVSNALKVGSLFTEPLEKPIYRNHHLLMSLIRNQKLKNIYLVTSNEHSPLLSQSVAFKSTCQS